MKILKGKKVIIGVVLLVLILSSVATVIICKSMKTIEESKEVSKLQADELPNYNDSGITGDLGKIEVGESKYFSKGLNYLLYHHTQGWNVVSENSCVAINAVDFDEESACISFYADGLNAGNDVIAVLHNGEKVARYSIQVVAKPSISLSKTSMTLTKGSYGTLTVTYTGNNVNVIVYDSTIAHVDYRDYGSGFTATVTADKVGSTQIAFSTSNGVEVTDAILNLTVTDSGSGGGAHISLSKTSMTLEKGSYGTLTVTYAGSNVHTIVHNSEIAHVNYTNSGSPLTVTVIADKVGTTQIAFSTINGADIVEALLNLTVIDSGSGGGGGTGGGGETTPAPQISYTGSKDIGGLVGATKTLSPAISWTHCKPNTITGTNNEIAEVQFEWGNGTSQTPTATKIKLKKAGTTTLTISAKNEDQSATATLNISVRVYSALTCTITSADGVENEGLTNLTKSKFTITFNQAIKPDSFTIDDIYTTVDKSKLALTKKDSTNKVWTLEITNPTTATPIEVYVKKDGCLLNAEESIKNDKSNVFKYTPDLVKPKVTEVTINSDKDTTNYNKDATIKVFFTIKDNVGISGQSHFDLEKNFKLYLINNNQRKDITSSANLTLNQEAYDSAHPETIKYSIKIKNLTQDQGKLDFEIINDANNNVRDKAGNIVEPYKYSTDTTHYKDIIIDNVKPKVTYVVINSGSDKKYYNKNATIKVNFTITDNIGISGHSQFDVEKNFKLYLTNNNQRKDITSSVNLSSKQEAYDSAHPETIKYSVEIKNIAQDQGKLDFEIINDANINVRDKAGNIVEPYKYSTDTTHYKDIIIDNIPPALKSIQYDTSDSWKKKQEIVVEVEDNYTPKDQIYIDYKWTNTTKTEDELKGTVLNQQKISKDTNYGVYQVVFKYEDLAGNYDIKVLNGIKLDAELSDKEMGKITVKNKNSGTNYKFPTNKIDNVYNGGYTQDNLEITLVNGSVDEGKESGHKTTTYQVYKKVQDEFVVVGDQTTAITNLYDKGTYKVIVTSKDIVGNSRSETYMLYKGVSNIKFEPNGGTGISASTKVTVVDNPENYNDISYVWIKEGEKITDNTNWTKMQNGETVRFSPKEKNTWYLYVKTTDKNGNVNITKSNKFIINGKIDKPGTLIYKKENENGEELKLTNNKLLTNKNVWINIKDGTDALGKVETTYKVTKNNKIVVGEGTSESTTLTEEGVYKVTITSKRVNDNLVETAENTITIDKTKPQVIFTPASESNAQIGKLKVDVVENEGIQEAQSGVLENSLRYYWVQGFVEPENFDEVEDEYRGKFTNGNVITAPNGSGIWVLWIYAKDKAGNVVKDKSIQRDNNNQTVSDNEVTKTGTLEIKKSNGQNYKASIEGEAGEAEYTNLNLQVKILPGYDKENGIVSNTYKIKKDGTTLNIDGKDEFDGEVLLKDHGTYVATIKTIDGAGNTGTKVYTMKIDKNGPVVKCEPNGNTEFAKQHEVTVSVTDNKTTTEIGKVNETSTKYVWVGYNDKNETLETIKNKLYEFIEEKEINTNELINKIVKKDSIAELKNKGIDVVPTNVSNKIKTPEGKTGKYILLVYAEDTLGNASLKISKEYYIDNTKPTVAEVRAVKSELVGTKVEEVNYYGEKVNKDVKVIAENSNSLSGVDRYECSYTTDGGKSWSNWTDVTKKEEGKVWGQLIVKEDGVTIVKFRTVAELIDGELISDETKEAIVKIDKKGPNVAYKNENDGQNGSTKEIEDIKVRVTVTDEEEIQVNPNTLKYIWTKFDSVENYEQNKNVKDFLKGKIESGVKFTNGELISSPENANGIYGLIIYGEDMLGNATYSISNYYNLKTDKEAPKVTFSNIENGENGSIEKVEKAKVRVTVTDKSGIAEETLKYRWIEFESVEKFEEYKKGNKSINELKNKMEIEKAQSFSNGEPVVSPDQIEGIYSLFIYAKDKKGNEKVDYSNYYVFGEKETENSNYEIDGKYIKRVIPGTTVSEVITEVKKTIKGTAYKVYNKNKEEIKEDEKVTTGSIISIDGKEYKIVVIGDLNGDGKLNGIDILKMRLYILGKYKLVDEYEKAADINNNGKVNGVDLLKMRQLNIGIADFTNK